LGTGQVNRVRVVADQLAHGVDVLFPGHVETPDDLQAQRAVRCDEQPIRDDLGVMQPGQDVLAVHHGRERGLCPRVPGPGRRRALHVHLDRQQLEILVLVLCVKSLPPGQLIAALSPRRPHEDQQALAPVVGQAHRPAVKVGQCKVWVNVTKPGAGRRLSRHRMVIS
jgi:hypothetical protein